MESRTRKYFDLLDGVWGDLAPRLTRAFTTQDFQYLLQERAPDVWAPFVERWGPGGRGSGKFYSPANVLNNYLKEKSRNGILLNNRFVPAAKGWGARIVNQWEFVESNALPASEEDWEFASSEKDWETVEGKQKLRLHLFRERDVDVRKRLLRARAATGLSCDVCGAKGDHLSEELRDAMFEAHHSSDPIANGVRTTRKEDVALLCACCHRLIHRLVSRTGRWVTVKEAKSLLAVS